MNLSPRKLIPAVLIALAVIFISLLIGFFLTHGFLSVTVRGQATQSRKYVLTNQDTGQSQIIFSSSNHIKKMVKKGNYELSLLETGRSAWTQTKAPGFMRIEQITLSPQSESGRSFVGNNPAPCSYYLGEKLISYECQHAASIVEHVPANASTPTYAQVIKNLKIGDTVDGIVKTAVGPVVITRSHDIESDTDLVTASMLDGAGNLTDQTSLDGVDSSADYQAASYQNGFVLFTSNLKSVLSFDSIHAQPRVVDLSSKGSNLKPLGLTAADSGIVAYYSSVDASDDPNPSAKISSVIVTNTGSEIQRYTFDTAISKASFCGKKICILSDNHLNIYSPSASTLHFDYQIVGVNEIQPLGSSLFAVNDQGILQLTNDSVPDHYAYTFNGYRSCGIGLNSGLLLACLITPRHDKISLLLQGDLTGYPIDVSVLTLLKNKQVQNVSTYKKYIYVTPNVGALKYDTQSNLYSYSEEQKGGGLNLVNDLVSKSKLDSLTYTVIDTLNP